MKKNKKIKRKPTYKQMAFETAVRNPERYKEILTAVYPFVGKKLDDDTLLEIVSSLYLNKIVSSDEVIIDENSTIENISSDVVVVNSTRRADGGFPEGYASRFWTYMRTLSELGFVYAQYQEVLQFSEIAIQLIENKIDEQEAFSLQAMKYNRRSPYRNVLNDFNFFKFILEILDQRERISYEQFVVATFSKNGNVKEFLEIIDNHTFNDLNDVETFLREKYETKLKAQTILRDYPDVVIRLLTITGFISIQLRGKVFIYKNIENNEYIKDLLSIPMSLTKEEKENPKLFFSKLETYNQVLLNIVSQYKQNLLPKEDLEYTKKVQEIIQLYKLDEAILIEAIEQIGNSKNSIPAFKYIAEPLKLEFYISLLIALKYGKDFAIKPNYKSDYIGLPISHAVGNTGDIEVFSKTIYWLIEVTLIRNKTQQINNETTSVIRHFLEDNKMNEYLKKYLSFVAPYVHQDTKEFYDFGIVRHKIKDQDFYLKPYDLKDFVSITEKKENFKDMESYTQSIFENFRKNLLG